MANDKRFLVKNGLLTQNIQFTDSAEGNNQITATMLGTDTLSFSGNTGQLFSITDSQSGTIFAVNDISGVPSIGVDDTGEIRLAETFGYVLVGTDSDRDGNTLQVTGGITIGGYGEVIDSNGNWTGVAIGGSVDSAQVLSIVTADGFTKFDSGNASGLITTAIDNLIDAAPAALDTLNELAAALGDDANFSTTVTNAIAALPDSAEVLSIITNAGFTKYDSGNTLGLIDSAYINARVTATGGGLDSADLTNGTFSNFVADSATFTSINFTNNDTITVSMLDSAILSFEGTSGQLFSVTDTLTGTIFSVNDISGIPSIEVDDDGTIRLAEFAGSVLLGTNSDRDGNVLQVSGGITISGYGEVIDSNGNWTGVAISGGGSVDSAQVLSIVTADGFTKYDSSNTLGLIDSAYINARVTAGGSGGLDSADLTNGTFSNFVADSATFTDVNFISPDGTNTIVATVTDSDKWKLIGTVGDELISVSDSSGDNTLFSVYSGQTEIFRVDDSAGSTRFAVYDDSANELFRVDDTTSGVIFTVYDRLNNVAISVDSDLNVNLNSAAGVTRFANHAISSQTATTTSTSQTAIATFNSTLYKSADIAVTAIDSDKTHMSKFSIIHNGTTASASEYGIIYTDSALATYAVDINSGDVRLLATPATTNSTIFNIALTLMDA